MSIPSTNFYVSNTFASIETNPSIAYDFKVTSATHFRVVYITAAGVKTTLTNVSNYVVTNVGNKNGGNINYIGTVAVGDKLVADLIIPANQSTTFDYAVTFQSNALETAIDYVTNLVKRVLGRTERSIRYPSEDTALGAILPDAATRADKGLSFDSVGKVTVTTVSDTGFEFTNVAALQANTTTFLTNRRVQVKGYYTAGAGDFGPDVYVDLTDTTTADDGLSCFVDTLGQRFKRSFENRVQAEWAGATGDGVTDDTLAIQSILDQNKICTLGEGVYRTTSRLELKRGSGIIGNDWSIYPYTNQTGETNNELQESILFYDPASPGENDSVLYSSAEDETVEVTSSFDNTKYGIILRDFVIDGGDKAAFGLYCVRPYEWDVYNLGATNTIKHGMFIAGAYSGSYKKLFAFENLGRGITFGGGQLFWGWTDNYQVNGVAVNDLHAIANGRNKKFNDADSATAWAGATAYTTGDRRSYGGSVYKARSNHTSHASDFTVDFAADKWELDDGRYEGYGLGLFFHRGNELRQWVSENNDGVGLMLSPSSGPNDYESGYVELNNYYIPAVTGGNITASDSTLTTTRSRPFNSSMVGKAITVVGAGPAAADLVTTIASYTSANEVELTGAASTTVANASVTIGSSAVSESRSSVGYGLWVDGQSSSLNNRLVSCFVQGGTYAQTIKLAGTQPSSGRPESGLHIENFYPSKAAGGGFDPIIAGWSNYRLINCASEIVDGISGSAPTGNLDIRGGISFGEEALKTYEEGFWIPVVEGSGTPGSHTLSVKVGRYTRIGNTVIFYGRIVITALDGAMTGVVSITGLPYTASNVGNLFSAVTIGDMVNMGSNPGALSGRIDFNTAKVLLFKHQQTPTVGVATSVQLVPSDFTSTTRLTLSGTYQVDQ